jgi:hypothetical protein
LFNVYPAKIGTYNIYQYQKSLIAVHEDFSIKDQTFKLMKYNTLCDIGMFSFNNFDEVLPYLDAKKSKKQPWSQVFVMASLATA